jgi:hypothetical protein
LTEPLAFLTHGIVVNYNEPAALGPDRVALRKKNVAALVAAGARVGFSKNFAPGRLEFDYLIEDALIFGVKNVRYDLAKPRADGKNSHFARAAQNRSAPKEPSRKGESPKEAAKAVVEFVKACAKAGLSPGLDCCLPFCLFEPDDLLTLKTLSQPFNGTCRPSVDILPDLSAIHCWPLKNLRVPLATAFDGEIGLVNHFAEAAYESRKNSRSFCPDCERPPSECQGGCLALGRDLGPLEISPLC